MGCIDTRPKNNELHRRQEESPANAAPPQQEPQKPPVQETKAGQGQQDPSASPIKRYNFQQPAQEEQFPIESAGQPSKIVKSRKREAQSYEEQERNRQINPQDIAVNASQNLVVMPGPKSTVIKAQIIDYNPKQNQNQQVLPKQQEVFRKGSSIMPRQSAYIAEQQVVNSEGGVNFTPSVRNLNFHVQIS